MKRERLARDVTPGIDDDQPSVGDAFERDHPVMADASMLRDLALALDGVTAAAHFDWTAFKVKRTFVTLAADGLSANFKFTPDEQALKCTVLPDAFSPVPNTWDQQGWTVGVLAKLKKNDLAAALETAWQHALPAPKKRKA